MNATQKARVARKIAEELADLRRCATGAELSFLGYLIQIAEQEADATADATPGLVVVENDRE